ncbi:MAG TPA: hypothetical protein VH229_10850 [Candidatus Udaeobacter sp.]|nr:hypothetical protein [Candidatus Udaeobacter sp.]
MAGVIAGVMADTAVTLAGMLSEDMPRPAMLRVDTGVSVLAVHAVTKLRGRRADTRALQDVHVIGMAAVTGAAVTGEAVTGEAVIGIRPLVILGSAITVWAPAMAITVTPTGGTIIRTTDTILIATDTGRP